MLRSTLLKSARGLARRPSPAPKAPRAGNARILPTETTALRPNGQATGAALLDALSTAPSDRGPPSIDTFLAAAAYLRSCSYELTRSRGSFEG